MRQELEDINWLSTKIEQHLQTQIIDKKTIEDLDMSTKKCAEHYDWNLLIVVLRQFS